MTDRSKLEQMLESLINDDKATAEELFHDYAVAKAREIYENLLDDDIALGDEETTEDFDVSEVSDEKADDMLDDMDADEEGEGEEEGEEGEEGGEEAATKDDLDTAKQDIIDALTAEFEAMMGGKEKGGEEMGPEEEMPMEFAQDELVMEYVDKVAAPKGGDDGANAKSVVAGKNDMGGTSANIAKGGDGGTGGKAPAAKDLASGNVNVPGSKTASKLNAVKKASGGDDGANAKSTLGA